jgi:Cdc6-like AAA superfamily ATPase
MRNPKKRMIICPNEVDQIKFSIRDEILILYNLTAISCGLILISNRLPTQFYNLDQRVRDRLNLHDIEFPDYSLSELFDICKDRREFAFVPRTLPDEMIQLAAENSNGDARLLLLIVKNAGRAAEERGAKRVEDKDIMKGVLEAKCKRRLIPCLAHFPP